MTLSRLAQEFADEIRAHDWSDAPFRADRAGHRRERDSNLVRCPDSDWTKNGCLDLIRTDCVRINVMWVVAQVLGHADPNLATMDIYEFAEACGVDTRTPSGSPRSGVITAGLRREPGSERLAKPGVLPQ